MVTSTTPIALGMVFWWLIQWLIAVRMRYICNVLLWSLWCSNFWHNLVGVKRQNPCGKFFFWYNVFSNLFIRNIKCLHFVLQCIVIRCSVFYSFLVLFIEFCSCWGILLIKYGRNMCRKRYCDCNEFDIRIISIQNKGCCGYNKT